MRVFKDWKQFAIYDNEKQGGSQGAIPHNAPPPRGKDVDLGMFVHSDHGCLQ